jgi:hypothetical protein
MTSEQATIFIAQNHFDLMMIFGALVGVMVAVTWKG